MKRLMIIAALCLAACDAQHSKEPSTYIPNHKESFAIETLSDQVELGLHKITIDDTVHILIYRGVESVTMIQIK